MTDGDLTTWKQRATEARAGELYLDDEQVARECLAACTKRIEDLQELGVLVQRAENVSGFGDFDMARALEEKFKTQANGDPNSAAEVIKDHIETVKNMQEVFAISLARLTGQDYTNASTLQGIVAQHPAPK